MRRNKSDGVMGEGGYCRGATLGCHVNPELARDYDSIHQGYMQKSTPWMKIAANRDEEEFKQADELILDRHNIKNHLGFGQGIHFCIGAALARLEIRVALEVFFSRTVQSGFQL